jgi:hypothetical protein
VFGMVGGVVPGTELGVELGVVLNGALEPLEGVSELNQPVNPVPAGSFPAIPFPAIPEVGSGSSGCGFTEPNMAVKSPTVFRGGWDGGEMLGVSAGRSPRNGPWKKLVNSPALGLSFGGALASTGKFLSRKFAGKGSGEGVRLGSTFGAEPLGGSGFHGGAGRTPERSGVGELMLGEGGNGGCASFGGRLGEAGLARGSNSRSNCVTELGAGCGGGGVGSGGELDIRVGADGGAVGTSGGTG